MRSLSHDLLTHPVTGQNLKPGAVDASPSHTSPSAPATLADQFEPGATHLLVFLRHFG